MTISLRSLYRHGFTLIELLVTISIITLLLSLSISAINSARIRSRDAKRIADLKTIQLALEQHLLGDASHDYPPDPSIATGANTAYCTKYDTATPGVNKGIYNNKCFSDFLAVVPKNTNDMPYTYASPGCFSASAVDLSGVTLAPTGNCDLASSSSYGLHVALESAKNQDASQDATPSYPLSYDLIP
jgi:prepilin-type N-terminal cleavage/methylation domain-containing protein